MQESSVDPIQRSVFASVDQVAGFTAAQEKEQQMAAARGSRIPSGQVTPRVKTASPGGPLSASRKSSNQKLLSMAMEAQRTRRLAAEARQQQQPEEGKDELPRRKSRHGHKSSETEARLSQPNEKEAERSTSSSSPEVRRGAAARQMDRASSLPDNPNKSKLFRTSAGLASASPERTRSRSGLVHQAKSSSLERATAIREPHVNEDIEIRDDPAEEDISESLQRQKLRNTSGTCPKSLAPPAAKPASLVDDEMPLLPDASGLLDSPIKLVPPADQNRIHALGGMTSDPSNVNSKDDDSMLSSGIRPSTYPGDDSDYDLSSSEYQANQTVLSTVDDFEKTPSDWPDREQFAAASVEIE